MPRTILLPLDGSALAEHALPTALQLASAAGHRLLLLRVTSVPTPDLDGQDRAAEREQAVREARTYLMRILVGIDARLPVTIEVVLGDPVPEILAAVERHAADLVVLATRGRTGLAQLLHGSVAEGVLAQSPVPVMLVHARPEDPPPADAGRFTTVLLALDGSSFAEEALPPALEVIDRRPGARLVLATVVPPSERMLRDRHGSVVAYLDQQEQARTWPAEQYLAEVRRRAQALAPELDIVKRVRLGEPQQGLIATALTSGAQLIVMATHARTGLQRTYLGSVALGVLRSADVPVLLVRPSAEPVGVSVRPALSQAEDTSRPWI